MKNIDISTLRSFHTVAQLGSVSRASKELFLTQSAISQHIKRLEGIVNLKLFEREGRSIVVTKQGEEFLEETRDLLKMNDSLFDKYCYSDQVKVVSIGLSEHLSQQYLPRLLSACSTKLPDIKLDIKIGLNGPLYSDLQEEKIDIAILINERNSWMNKPALVAPQKLCWVGNNDKQWDVDKIVPVVLYSGPCLFRAMLISTLKAHRREWKPVYNASSIADLTAALHASLGVSALLESEVDQKMVIADNAAFPILPDVDAVVHTSPRKKKEIKDIVTILGDSIFAELV